MHFAVVRPMILETRELEQGEGGAVEIFTWPALLPRVALARVPSMLIGKKLGDAHA